MRAQIPERPGSPFPIEVAGIVTKGFGRGSRELGFPTANIPPTDIPPQLDRVGVYFGYAMVRQEVFSMVMSLGYNPYYKNVEKSLEIYIVHEFKSDFYGESMRAIVCGWLRPELDYTTRDALIQDIRKDVTIALTALEQPAYAQFKEHPIFKR